MLKVLDLFSGIGGFSLGLERTGGFQTVAFCEIDPFCRRVLAKHWPNVRQYEDVRELTAERLAADGIAVDVITGGFPCQDISIAGKQAGIADGTRSGLWSEIARLTRDLRPRFLIVENVANLLSGPSERPGAWFGRVLGDLAEVGYDAEWNGIPASALGAPHQRDRVWVVAYPNSEGARKQHNRAGARLNGQGPVFDVADTAGDRWPQRGAHAVCRNTEACADRNGQSVRSRPSRSDANSSRLEGQREVSVRIGAQLNDVSDNCWWSVEPAVGRVAHGVPNRVDRLRSLGNAVVPQIPELIGRAILAAEAA